MVDGQMESRDSLTGLSIILTRPSHMIATLQRELEDHGATCIGLPLIATRPIDTPDVRRMLQSIGTYDALVVTSANGLRAMAEVYSQCGWPVALPTCYCIGSSTAELAQSFGLRAIVFPGVRTGEAFGARLVAAHADASPSRFLIVHSAKSEERVRHQLSEAGHDVTSCKAYDTVHLEADVDMLTARLPVHESVVITLFSPSALFAWQRNLPRIPTAWTQHMHIACIGQTTADACVRQGFHVDMIAEQPTARDLRIVIEQWWLKHNGGERRDDI